MIKQSSLKHSHKAFLVWQNTKTNCDKYAQPDQAGQQLSHRRIALARIPVAINSCA